MTGVVGLSEPQKGGGLVFIPESTWGEVYQYEEPKSVVLRLAGSLEVSFTEAEWEILREDMAERCHMDYECAPGITTFFSMFCFGRRTS